SGSGTTTRNRNARRYARHAARRSPATSSVQRRRHPRSRRYTVADIPEGGDGSRTRGGPRGLDAGGGVLPTVAADDELPRGARHRPSPGATSATSRWVSRTVASAPATRDVATTGVPTAIASSALFWSPEPARIG